VRDKSATEYDLALVTADLKASPAQVIERYAARWRIEVAIEDAKQEFGAAQAATAPRTRSAAPSRSSSPARPSSSAGTPPPTTTAPTSTTAAPAPPSYTSKTQPSTADITAKLRRVLIAARFKASRPDQPTPEEIPAIRLAWETPAAQLRKPSVP
jgi:hypothetical protein